MTAREEILARVDRLTSPDPVAPCTGEYVRAGSMPEAERVELFASRLRDYDAGVYFCAPDGVAEAVAAAVKARGKSQLLCSENLPREWRHAQIRFRNATGLDYAAIDAAEGVITGCAAAIALTGTILLTHAAGESARALTLIPDYHLSVVRADQIVETVPEGFERIRGHETVPITTISGPSATADIEMTRVKGVHGPRFLDVIIVR